jgi:hypothetical protein
MRLVRDTLYDGILGGIVFCYFCFSGQEFRGLWMQFSVVKFFLMAI